MHLLAFFRFSVLINKEKKIGVLGPTILCKAAMQDIG